MAVLQTCGPPLLTFTHPRRYATGICGKKWMCGIGVRLTLYVWSA